MDDFPEGYRQLFDAVIKMAGDDITGHMLYRVELIDRFRDGPHVPSVLGSSPVYESLEDAITFARGAVHAFQGDDPHSS